MEVGFWLHKENSAGNICYSTAKIPISSKTPAIANM
jgi:hypothetical protein